MSEDLNQLKAELAELAASFKSPNQLAFAKEWGAGKSQEQAYIDAGYKSKKPSVDAFKAVERCPTIAQYRNLLQKIAQLESLPKQIATLDQKRSMLWEIAQRCVQEVEPVHEGFGEDRELVGYTFNAKGAIGAIAELNKMDGDLAAIKTDNKHSHALEDLTEQQLDTRLADLQRKAGIRQAT